jgi:hypothetical protein
MTDIVRSRLEREGGLLEHHVVRRLLDVVVSAESEVSGLLLGGVVHPSPVVTTERSLLVVVGDDVLPQFRANGLEEEAEVADDREVAEDRVLALYEVVDADDQQDGDDRTEDDQPDHGGSLGVGPGPEAAVRCGHTRASTSPACPR